MQKSPSNDQSSNKIEEHDNDFALPDISPTFLQWVLLIQKLIDGNTLFENYFYDRFANKFIILTIYYIKFYNHLTELNTTLIPILINFSLKLSSKTLVQNKFLQTFTNNYYNNKLPNAFKISNVSVPSSLTYRDFAIIHLCNLSINDTRSNLQLRPYLFELIYNLLLPPNKITKETMPPLSNQHDRHHTQHTSQTTTIKNTALNYNASLAILHLLAKLSNKTYLSSYSQSTTSNSMVINSYLSSPSFKLDLLSILLRVISIFIIKSFKEAKNLIFVLARHQGIIIQLNDSLISISRQIQSNQLKMNDFLQFQPNELSGGTIINGNNDSNSNNNSNSNINQNDPFIVFNKKLPNYDDTTMQLDEAEQDWKLSHKLSNTESPNKNIQIVEHLDYSLPLLCNDANANDLSNFELMKPNWPLGINFKNHGKHLQKLNLIESWSGNDSLKMLTRMIKIFLTKFPTITTITTNNYYNLIDQFDSFEDEFFKIIEKDIPIYIKEMEIFEQLSLNLPKNLLIKDWNFTLCWADIFHSHSTPYIYHPEYDLLQLLDNNNNSSKLPQPRHKSSTSNLGFNTSSSSTIGLGIAKDNRNFQKESTGTGTPTHLERYTSNNSTLSRTTSNGSSVMNYFTSQQSQQTPQSLNDMDSHLNNLPSQSALDLISNPAISTSSTSPNVNSNNNTNSTTNSAASSPSFFRFSWTGFIKNEQETIQESPSGNNTNSSPPRVNPFTMDTGLIRSNIWAGTKIKLFPVKKDTKEEFSFLDMTSSLLKRFRFNTSGSSDTIPESPTTGRPYTPRNSMSSTFSQYGNRQ